MTRVTAGHNALAVPTGACQTVAMSEFAGQTLRVALLSDTHGFLDPRVGAYVEQCDLAIHAGDLGCLSILDQIRPRQGRVIAVLGNNDNRHEWPEEDVPRLEEIPRLAHVNLPGGVLTVIHGHNAGPLHSRHERLRRRFPDARVILIGHSHHPYINRDVLPWVLNPGAAGRFRTYGGPGCMVLTVSETEWELEAHRFSPRKRRRPKRRDAP